MLPREKLRIWNVTSCSFYETKSWPVSLPTNNYFIPEILQLQIYIGD